MRAFIISLVFLLSIVNANDFDHKVPLEDSGFWGAHYDVPKYSTVGLLLLATYEGSESRLGKTTWQSLDAGLMSQVVTEGFKISTGRLRPRDTNSPNDWGQGGKSFFSGHVSGMTALVTPFVLEYQEDYPLIHLLWALPIHQMGGRVKAQAHWQSDVVAAALVGFLSGYWAHSRETSLLLYFNKGNTFVGFKHKF